MRVCDIALSPVPFKTAVKLTADCELLKQQICRHLCKTSAASSRLVNCGFASLAAPSHPSHGCSPVYTHYHNLTIHQEYRQIFIQLYARNLISVLPKMSNYCFKILERRTDHCVILAISLLKCSFRNNSEGFSVSLTDQVYLNLNCKTLAMPLLSCFVK